MSFLAPLMLWGTLAASVPIALHFFFRSRYRRVPWAAMQFLLTSIEQTSRRLKFQELLLLLARVAVLVLLALALARPTSALRSGTGQGDAVDAIVVLDTSYSMAARDGAVTRLDRARTAALAVIDQLPPHSTVQVIACSDRANVLGPRAPANLEQARQLVQAVPISDQATDVLPGLREAATLLRRGQSPGKEVYLFSDLQKSGWDQQPAALTEKLQDLHNLARIYLVRCGTQTPRNAAIVDIVPQTGIPHTGERVGFVVLVRNSGTEPVRDLTVSLMVDGHERDKDSRPLPILAPGETRPVVLTARLERPGLRIVTTTLRHDDLDADNRLDQVLFVREQVRVLVVEGASNEQQPEKSASYYLMHALRPISEPDWGSYHIQPRVVAAVHASPALLADKDLCILASVAVGPTDSGLAPEFLEGLAGFVREGHGLLIVGGPRVVPEAYNRLLHAKHGLLPLPLANAPTAPADPPWHLDPGSVDGKGFLAAFAEEPLNRIGEVEIVQALGIQEPPAARAASGEARVALRYSNGQAALVSKKVGAGEVMLLTTSAETTWTDWPLRPTFVPFVHVALSHLLQEQAGPQNHVAGEPLVWHPADKEATRPFAVIAPDGSRTRLGVPDRAGEHPVLIVTQTPRAGIYRIVAAEGETAAEVPFAVVPDLRESEDLTALSDPQLDERLGFKAVHLTASEDLSVFAGTERLSQEWTLWLLGIVLALALGETGLAWYCGRAR
jgi:hypothetical protein